MHYGRDIIELRSLRIKMASAKYLEMNLLINETCQQNGWEYRGFCFWD